MQRRETIVRVQSRGFQTFFIRPPLKKLKWLLPPLSKNLCQIRPRLFYLLLMINSRIFSKSLKLWLYARPFAAYCLLNSWSIVSFKTTFKYAWNIFMLLFTVDFRTSRVNLKCSLMVPCSHFAAYGPLNFSNGPLWETLV